MTKTFCDICQKEDAELTKVTVPMYRGSDVIEYGSAFGKQYYKKMIVTTKTIEICRDCATHIADLLYSNNIYI